jgi:threonine/homoserine/homoserine lactone efflux protein
MSTLGINLGSVVAILIAAFGLSYLLDLYPNALLLIQIVGGVFVIYLAVQTWPRSLLHQIEAQDIPEESYSALFKNGFITSVLNPKDILFYTAFIPTFIPQNVIGKSYQSYFLLLAVLYMLIGFLTKTTFAIFAGYTKNALNSSKAIILNYISSLILFFLGLYLVVKSLSHYVV